MTTAILEKIENQEGKEVKNMTLLPVLKIDEEFKNLLNPLSDIEFSLLEKSIMDDKKCREPITVWNGFILDGHNRYKICTDKNIFYSTIEMTFSNREEAILWALNANFGRRHLNNAAKCKAVMKVFHYYKEKAIAKQKGEEGDVCNVTKQLADLASVSVDTMSRFINIMNSSHEETKQKLHNGELSINKAYKLINPPAKKKSSKDSFRLKEIEVTNRTGLKQLLSAKSDLGSFMTQIDKLIKQAEEKAKQKEPGVIQAA